MAAAIPVLIFIVAAAGLILAISGGPLFPWANLVGALVLLFIAVKINQHHSKGDNNADDN